MPTVLFSGADRDDDGRVRFRGRRDLLPRHVLVDAWASFGAHGVASTAVDGVGRGDHFLEPAHAAKASTMRIASATRYWVSCVANAIPVKAMTTSGGSGHS